MWSLPHIAIITLITVVVRCNFQSLLFPLYCTTFILKSSDINQDRHDSQGGDFAENEGDINAYAMVL